MSNYHKKKSQASEYVTTLVKPTRNKFNWDRFTGEWDNATTWWLNVTGLWLLFSILYIFFVSSSHLQFTKLIRFARFVAQMTCFVLYTCLFRVWSLQIHFIWVRGAKKHQHFDQFLDIADLQRNSLKIRALKSKLPLNVEITSPESDVWLEVQN